MNAKSQPERIWFVVAPLLVWFSTAYSASLTTHLYFVLFQRDTLKDGQYVMIFPFGAGLGFVAGTIPLALTMVLSHRKPEFAPIASWVALGYIAFWTIVTTACEAIVLREGVGFGVLATLVLLPVAVLFIWLSVMIAPLQSFLTTLSFSLTLVVLLLVAFYFTPPRGWN
jgi:ABC-type multidrug transport system permease subunit